MKVSFVGSRDVPKCVLSRVTLDMMYLLLPELTSACSQTCNPGYGFLWTYVADQEQCVTERNNFPKSTAPFQRVHFLHYIPGTP